MADRYRQKVTAVIETTVATDPSEVRKALVNMGVTPLSVIVSKGVKQ